MNHGVTLDIDGGIATLLLTASARRNALTVAMAQAMIDACEMIDANPAVGAVIVHGEGYFCAGADRELLQAAGSDPADPRHFDTLGLIYESFARVGRLAPPTIAAVVGGAVGAGLNLALATSLRVVAQDATLLSGFLPIGLHPGGGHTALLMRAAGQETAHALALFGERLSGVEAARRGLAWAAVPAAEVLPTARRLAAVPAADPALARRTAASLRATSGPPALPASAALELERAAQMWSLRRRELS
ncbi:MAG TPA: enoyl-CoA hydratase-related protein [Solirubrobacteraceae bacterium]|nr:enoyl-CoA hydratase-related protein [Solirubrobacteraceae bacterium]